MYLAISNRLISILGRVAIMLAMWSAIPQNSCEAFAEGEAVVLVQCEFAGAAERCEQRAVYGQLHLQSNVAGHRIGQCSLVGHDGRRISATLLAPLRC